MCLYIVDNVSTCRIIYFRYVDMEKRIDNSPKNNRIQRIFQQQSLKNHMSDLAEIWELGLVCLSLCNRPTFFTFNTITLS